MQDNAGETQRRSDPAATHLAKLAGPDLYRRNAFAVTGLATDVAARAVREQHQRFGTLADAGDERAKAALPAFEELRDPRRRIVHELLWFWDVPEPACGCPKSLHTAHDAAISSHVQALAREREKDADPAEVDQLWADAAHDWQQLLRRVAVWDHVRHRIDALGDRRLDESTVDELRAELPRALVRTVTGLAPRAHRPAELARRAAYWELEPGLVADALAEAVRPLRESIQTTVDQAYRDRVGGELERASLALLDVVPTAWRLDALLPRAEHRGTARLLDQLATQLNNAALELGSPRRKRKQREPAAELYTAALSLMTAPADRRIITANQRSFTERMAKQRRAARLTVTGCVLLPLCWSFGVLSLVAEAPPVVGVSLFFGPAIYWYVVAAILKVSL